MIQPLVSVIIPLYNNAKHIAAAIQSARAQTWPNIEIIVVDDGSTDSSLTVAGSFASEKIMILSQPNKGASAARNTGLRAAKGDYIQFLDADDMIGPTKVQQQMMLIGAVADHLCTGPTVHFTDGENPVLMHPKADWYEKGSSDMPDFLTKLYGGSLIGSEYGGMIALHSWLIPNRLIQKAGFWNESLSLDDDGEFMCRVILSARNINYAAGAVSYYRKHGTGKNISSATSYAAHVSLLDSARLKMKHLLAHKDDHLSRRALSRIFTEIAVSFYPGYPALTKQAESIARELDPTVQTSPFTTVPAKMLTRIFGWRTVRILSVLRQKWI